MLFPLPRPLPDLLRDTSSSLTPLDKAGARQGRRPSLNLFFDVRMRPRFPLFDACDGGAADASLAQAPPVHRQALERLGVGPARAAYCAHI